MDLNFGSKWFLTAFMLVALSYQITSNEQDNVSIREKFKDYMATYGRVYESEVEQAKRFEIFKANVEFIETFNNAENRSHKLAINMFTDLTNTEFSAQYTGYKSAKFTIKSDKTPFRYQNVTDQAPPSIDWRSKGAVTGVKNQLKCGKVETLLPRIIYHKNM